MAPSTLQIPPHLCIASLLVMEHPSFRAGYERGLAWSLFERERVGPLADRYLSDRLTEEIVRCPSLFAPSSQQRLGWWVGFWLGMVHGGVLLRNGSLHPCVTALVTLHDRQCIRGYYAGRHYYFTEAETDEQRTVTDTHVLDQCWKLAAEYGTYQDSQGTLRYTIGGMVGRLSGVLFPWTPQEQAQMEQESVRILGYIEPLRPGCLAYQMSLQPA